MRSTSLVDARSPPMAMVSRILRAINTCICGFFRWRERWVSLNPAFRAASRCVMPLVVSRLMAWRIRFEMRGSLTGTVSVCSGIGARAFMLTRLADGARCGHSPLLAKERHVRVATRGNWRAFRLIFNAPRNCSMKWPYPDLSIRLRCVACPDSSLYPRKVEKDDEARSAALALLARGMITPSQAAELAGVSRQLVRYWLRHAGIDWRRAWQRRQASMWRREIAALNGKVLQPPSKRELRRRAQSAKAQWDAKHRPH